MGPKLSYEETGNYSELDGPWKSYYINEEWPAKSLSYVYPGTEDAVADAVPILLRIMLHHGTYPFKPPSATQLTTRQAAIAVAILTARDRAIIIRHRSKHKWRYRSWNDRSHLLFQSLCDTDWSRAASRREREDDEDLIAALESSHGWNMKKPVFGLAKTLPSSHSRKLEGTVSLREIKALLALIVAASIRDEQGEPSRENAIVESTVLALLGDFPDPDGRIDWEEFRHLTASRMPFLLMNLAILIAKLAPIEYREDDDIYPTTYTWAVPRAIQGTGPGSKRSFLTMQHVSQLGFVIRRHELDALRLLRQERPSSLSSSDIADVFNNSPQGHNLLLVQGMTNKIPIVLVCTLPSLTQKLEEVMKEEMEESPLTAPGSDDDCIVQLQPTHRVLRSTIDVARVSTSSVNPGDLLFDLGGVKVWFTNALETGLLEEGTARIPFSVDLIEVWGR